MSRACTSLRYCYMLAALLAASGAQAATAMQTQIASQVDTACKISMSRALAVFRPKLAAYPDIRDKEDIITIVPWLEMNARAQVDSMQIVINQGLCSQIWLLSIAFAVCEQWPTQRRNLLKYIQYLRAIVEPPARRGMVFVELEILTFPLWAHVDMASWSPQEQVRVSGIVNMLMNEALAFVVAHEIGHIALRHNAQNNKISRANEYAADKFALDLVEKTGYSFIGAIPTLLAFISDEELSKQYREGSHPPAACRLRALLLRSKELQKTLKDPAGQAEIELNLGMSAKALRKMLNTSEAECAEQT